MCIVLVATTHPSYALIVIDNRDEFILRPTSRPHWWSVNRHDILSARDLQRAEQGTWLGVTKTGKFAVLTNYRETDTHDKMHPVSGTRSRGGMVTAWLTGLVDEGTEDFVHRLLEGEGVKGVGGFSLLCGKLRKRRNSSPGLEPLAVISNRSGSPDDVPWIAGTRGEVYGLSNTSYADPVTWPKVKIGKDKLTEAIEDSIRAGLGEEQLVDRLFDVLDTNTLPEQNGQDFEQFISQLRKSIFIPAIGKPASPQDMPNADQIAAASMAAVRDDPTAAALNQAERPDEASNGMSGIYGTQRQTVILVDWDGHVTFRERALWDSQGQPIERGLGDMSFKFHIEGWQGESKGNHVHPLAAL